MGQVYGSRRRKSSDPVELSPFPDISSSLPPELAIHIMSNLNATELCMAAGVNDSWQGLASDNRLWRDLCMSTWGCVSAYRRRAYERFGSFKELYLILDEGTVMFNVNPKEGISYLISLGVIDDTSEAIAAFLHSTRTLKRRKLDSYLTTRCDVLEKMVLLDNYANQFLPDALRSFFCHIPPPKERGKYLEFMLEKFSKQFCICNPGCPLREETVYILCYSLILLSVDLTSPHVKNKMSKREFIRNLRRATPQKDDDYFGHLYDNIYLAGHVAPPD
ncbi:F-box only protein 8-like [Oscarella lobularis]|uniref:F-box only protein 8-like n=1 Tax=Oscarella lobularis TaxID=121494 RepID=UPI0033136988